MKNDLAIIGLGYVGAPLFALAVEKGFNVRGVDLDESRLVALRAQLPEANVELGTTLTPANVFIICVPTPVTDRHEPDLAVVEVALRDVASVLQDGDTVVIESTIYPGVCEDIAKPILDASGVDYHLGHCPERINPGDPKWSVRNIPRVVGGLKPDSTERIASLYRSIVDAEVITVGTVRAAEATKILENTFRDINIAFVNEMALSFQKLGIDITEVIRAASTKPFGFLPHYPGAGVGGHCIAVDPYYMIERGRAVGFDHEFLRLSRKINSNMPKETVYLVQDGLNELRKPVKGSKVTVLGLAYKPDVADDRESPSYELVRLLRERGATVHTYDPYFPAESTVASLEEALEAECVVLATAHGMFVDRQSELNSVELVVDGRNALDPRILSRVLYVGIGRPFHRP